MNMHEDLKKAIPDAMRARDAVRLRTLRSLITAMTNELVNKKRPPDEFLTDEETLVVIKRAVNQHKDSIEQFEKAFRADLADPEKEELAILQSYLPAQMSIEEITTIIKAKISELNIDTSDVANKGKFMGTLMKEFSGKADGADIKKVVDGLIV